MQLSLSIPIFDRLSKHSNIAKRKNAYDRAQADYEQALQTVEAEVRRAIICFQEFRIEELKL